MPQRETLEAWAMPSSRGTTTYETIVYTDGTTSCDCPGWVYAKKGRERTCKHIRELAGVMRQALERHRQATQTPPRVRVSDLAPAPVNPWEDGYEPLPPPRQPRPAPILNPKRRIRLINEEDV